MLKLGLMSFSNSLPFHARFSVGQRSCQTATFHFGVPSDLNRALRQGDLDISFISAAEYLQNEKQYVLLPEFCIGARDRVRSVCLFLRHSIRSLDQRPVGLTTASASSALLLRVLCNLWKVTPHFRPHPQGNDPSGLEGLLLIGDECLRQESFPPFHAVDLAQAWYHATGLPFTFGVLAARKSVAETSANAIAQVMADLQESLVWTRQHFDQVAAFALQNYGIRPELYREYYSLLRYPFDAEQREGLATFKQMVESYANATVP